MTRARLLALTLLAALAGAGIAWLALRPPAPPRPDAQTVLTQVREVARLETLELRLYKKLDFAPEPTESGSLWKDVAAWARYSISRPRGRVILFADAQVGLDLEALTPERIRVSGGTVELALPPLRTQVLLRPEETEVLDSNLDTEETAALFSLAKRAFEEEVANDPELQRKARGSAERALRGLLLSLGFREVRFVSALAAPAT